MFFSIYTRFEDVPLKIYLVQWGEGGDVAVPHLFAYNQLDSVFRYCALYNVRK